VGSGTGAGPPLRAGPPDRAAPPDRDLVTFVAADPC